MSTRENIRLIARVSLLPYAFKWDVFGKDDFLKTVEAKVILITRYVQPNDTMTVNKFQGQG